MAVRVSGKVKTSGAYTDVYWPSHIKAIVGLLNGTKIDRSILPTATGSDLGAVKLSADYDVTTPGADVVLSQTGAKTLYNALLARVQNLESPLDYIGSTDFTWTTSTTSAQITTAIRAWIDTNISDALTLHAGHTMLIYNEASAANAYKQPVGPAFIITNGYWLWIYNGSSWDAAIDFPDVPQADYSGATESAMIAGIISKAMLWKLKNIEAGAQVNTVNSVAGKTGAVALVKADVGLGNVDNTADSAKEVLNATRLKTARTIAGVSFDGSANISIPFANLSSKPTTISGYGITDAQPLDADLTSIAGLTGTSGFLKKTAANAWALDEYMEPKIFASLPAVANVPEGRIVLVQEEII